MCNGRVSKGLAVLLSVSILALVLTGCDGGQEEEVTPQRFIFDYGARSAVAQTREPSAVVERSIPVGTMVPVRLLTRLSSATARAGDTFQIQVLADVIVDGAVVIAAGSSGQGRVTEVEAAKGWGKSGHLRISVDFVYAVDGQHVPIEANEQTAARDREVLGAGTVVGVVFFGPLWLFAPALAKGKNVVVPADSQFYVMVRAPVRVQARIY